MAKQRNPNRGVVLTLADAYALHRWLELLMDDRRFFNPIEAHEAEQAAKAAKARLCDKLAAIVADHRERDLDDETGMTADERAWLG